MLKDCQLPDLDPCWALKLDQDETKQIPFEAKKILPRRDQDLYIIQKHMLAATGPLWVLHDMLENGECSKEQTLWLLEKSLCLLGSASTGLTTLRRTKVLAYINYHHTLRGSSCKAIIGGTNIKTFRQMANNNQRSIHLRDSKKWLHNRIHRLAKTRNCGRLTGFPKNANCNRRADFKASYLSSRNLA